MVLGKKVAVFYWEWAEFRHLEMGRKSPLTCGFMQLVMLQFKRKLQKCMRMGITIFKNFIWVGMLSDIQSEITFCGSTHTVELNFRMYTSLHENFEYSNPLNEWSISFFQQYKG